jgi:hypothetical protein
MKIVEKKLIDLLTRILQKSTPARYIYNIYNILIIKVIKYRNIFIE